MSLRRTSARLGLVDTITKIFLDTEDGSRVRRAHKGYQKQLTAGYHWLEWHYRLPLYQLIWYNTFRYPATGEVLVGRDWRGNMFFIRPDPTKPGGVARFARFIEAHELPQDYDTDHLWKCARLYKYQEDRYSLGKLALEKMDAMYAIDPPHEQVRRYQEYMDQKWDVRRSAAIRNNIYGQRWRATRQGHPDIQDKHWYGHWRAAWEYHNYKELDLLRPPRKQHVWKVEDDARALKYLEAIENPQYQLNPFELTRKERYMRTPSHVAGREVPKTQITLTPMHELRRGKLPAAPIGEHLMRISDRNPIYGLSSADEFKKWFAEQRKHLVAARAELEQMKRDGLRPRELGGDEDPYESARPGESLAAAAEQREQLLAAARTEREALEEKKKAALAKIVKSGTQSLAASLDEMASKPFTETPVYTRVTGKVTPGAAKRYRSREAVVRSTMLLPDDDSTAMDPSMSHVKSVFGQKGKQLFAGVRPADQISDAERPDNVAPQPNARDGDRKA